MVFVNAIGNKNKVLITSKKKVLKLDFFRVAQLYIKAKKPAIVYQNKIKSYRFLWNLKKYNTVKMNKQSKYLYSRALYLCEIITASMNIMSSLFYFHRFIQCKQFATNRITTVLSRNRCQPCWSSGSGWISTYYSS